MTDKQKIAFKQWCKDQADKLPDFIIQLNEATATADDGWLWQGEDHVLDEVFARAVERNIENQRDSVMMAKYLKSRLEGK